MNNCHLQQMGQAQQGHNLLSGQPISEQNLALMRGTAGLGGLAYLGQCRPALTLKEEMQLDVDSWLKDWDK